MSAQAFFFSAAGVTATQPRRHLVVPRFIAGLPLLAIGLMHIAHPDLRMEPLVDAAGFPLASILAPLAVALEVAAGAMLLLGAYARIGALLALPVMAGAVYAHIAIDTWPNGADNEPPMVLPLAVMVCALYVLRRGAGRWSLDHWRAARALTLTAIVADRAASRES